MHRKNSSPSVNLAPEIRPNKLERHESILVFAPSWIGDAVMSLGAVRVLRRERPEARIVALTRPSLAELYEGVGEVDATLAYDPRGSDRGLSGLRAAARRIRSEGFDACLLLPNAFRAAAIARLAGIPERWGYATESRGFLLTRKVPPAPRPFGRHQAYYYLELMSGLGFHASTPDVSLKANDGERERARALLEREGWDGRASLIGVHPGATGSRAKIWSAARFGEVMQKLAASMGARVVVLGGASESAFAREVEAALKAPPLMLQGKTSLGELIGVLSELSLFLSNDSGPMHLAAALGVPTLAVFGPTDPRETGPLGTRAKFVREPVECSPCLYRDCPIDHRCMERVGVSRVYEEAMGLAPVEARLS
jgi:heptosyltransferase-2